MGTLFIFFILKKQITTIISKPEEISIYDRIELFHPTYYSETPCVNFEQILSKKDFLGVALDSVLTTRIIINSQKYGPYNCIDDLLDISGIDSHNIQFIYDLSSPDFMDCSLLNINTATAKEVASFFRININKGKTLVKYRKSIGGFVKFEQIKQVYGFPKSKLKHYWKRRVKIESHLIHKIDINSMSYLELVKHGFISKKSASTLYRYRKNRDLTLQDIRQEVSVDNKPLITYYFKE